MHEPEFWRGHDYTAKLVSAALTPASWAYGATVSFKSKHARPYRSSTKVVCVGNLTVGGAGKTPIAIGIARQLIRRGTKTWGLTRGYGGNVSGPMVVNLESHLASDVGDEALVLAAAMPTIVSSNRAAGAQLAEQKGAQAIVMDDGHQNFSLAKDLSIVVVDAASGFGNNRIVPAGPLRESVKQGLARADAAVIVGADYFDIPSFERPILRAELTPTHASEFVGKTFVAFAGIGKPEKFFATLRKLGVNLLDALPFADHHVYSEKELAQLSAQAKAKCAGLITTQKDFVRLPPEHRAKIACLPIEAKFENPASIDSLLDTLFPCG